MSFYIPTRLLTDNNNKTIKGEKEGWKTFILYLSPHKQNSLKVNLCPFASPGCIASCLYNSGKGGFPIVQKGRMNKSEFFIHNQELFMAMLVNELHQHQSIYKNLAVRLNGTSDIEWEDIKIGKYKNIFTMFPKIKFYDYTKNYQRFSKKLPKNYNLVFSRSEINEPIAMELLAKGHNVAMVFNKIPTNYMGYTVINGDENDLRFLETTKKQTATSGKIVGLKYKVARRKGVNNTTGTKTGFVITIS
jgi:hypothetical protein